MNFYPQILSDNQKVVLSKLKFLTDENIYLIGGTALAMQLGHRNSLDFDFYCPHKFDNKKIRSLFSDNFSNFISDSNQPEDTFQGRAENVDISIFLYDYPFLGQLVDYPPVKLAGLDDLAGMKIVSLVQRARQRDFADVFYLMKELGDLEVVKAAFMKYPWYEENPEIILRSLTYFEEADRDKEAGRVVLLDKNVTWAIIKTELTNRTKKIKSELEKSS